MIENHPEEEKVTERIQRYREDTVRIQKGYREDTEIQRGYRKQDDGDKTDELDPGESNPESDRDKQTNKGQHTWWLF